MAIGAKDPQVLKGVVLPVAIHVVQLKPQWFLLPHGPESAALTPLLFETLLDQPLKEMLCEEAVDEKLYEGTTYSSTTSPLVLAVRNTLAPGFMVVPACVKCALTIGFMLHPCRVSHAI